MCYAGKFKILTTFIIIIFVKRYSSVQEEALCFKILQKAVRTCIIDTMYFTVKFHSGMTTFIESLMHYITTLDSVVKWR